MTIDQLVVAKTVAAVATVGAGIVTAVQAASPAGLPIGWSEVVVLVTCGIAWGNLNGRLKERERADERRDKRLRYLGAVTTRIAESNGISIADLQRDLGD